MGEVWRCRELGLPVFERVHVMGILNVTPDSFSDGGWFLDEEAAVKHGIRMALDGADIVDVGGESTRPGAPVVPEGEELRRVIPVISRLAGEIDTPISIDTTKAAVARAALDAGACIVNDVSAMRFDEEMAGVVARSGAGVVLMHMKGDPATMQRNPRYRDVVTEVRGLLMSFAAAARSAGIAPDRIAIDPGIGFGKTARHSLTLLKHLRTFAGAGYPLLVGPSRKSFIGATLGLGAGERLEATAAVVAWAVAEGANVVRVHDVKEMVRVVRMVEAVMGA
ncbi:MAG: dihydropteroate synthase [Actinomycetota bacterium]